MFVAPRERENSVLQDLQERHGKVVKSLAARRTAVAVYEGALSLLRSRRRGVRVQISSSLLRSPPSGGRSPQRIPLAAVACRRPPPAGRYTGDGGGVPSRSATPLYVKGATAAGQRPSREAGGRGGLRPSHGRPKR